MRKLSFFLLIFMFPALAQEDMFGYKVLNEPLEPAVASYIGRDVWAYGDLRIYCQNPINTPHVYRFYYTTPKNKLVIHNLVRVELREDNWEDFIHVNGGLIPSRDYSGVASETAFLLTLTTDTPIVNSSWASDGNLRLEELYVSCQKFFTFTFPKANYLERIFSFESVQDVAREQGWSEKALADVLDMVTSVQPGMTKDMVLWKLGAPLTPLELNEAMNALHWYYLSNIPFSKDVTFDKKNSEVIKYVEGRLH